MKSSYRWIALAAGAIILSQTLALAQEVKPFDIEAKIKVTPKYVWRGVNLNNNWVIQPQATISKGPFSLNLWANYEPTNWNLANYTQAPRGRFTELDMTFEYSRTSGPVEWGVGIVDYQFPGTGWLRYQEWYASASMEDLWGSPSLTVWTGNNSRSGTYATVGVSHALPTGVAGVGEIDLEAALTYGDARSNEFYYGSRKAAFTDLELKASKSVGLGSRFTLTPALHFTTLLDRSLLAGQPRRTNLWLSLSVGAKF